MPGVSGLDLIESSSRVTPMAKARDMTQKAVLLALARLRLKGLRPAMAFIREGPYAVPYPASN